MEVDAVNGVGAQVGDRILLYFKTGSLLTASFLLYVLPICCMLMGAIFGNWLALQINIDASLGSAATGFLMLVLSFAAIRAKANRLGKKNAYKPHIIRVLGHETLA